MSRGLISETILIQIKERLDIADLVSGHVTLTRAGQNLKARCPFHDERTPSFTVSPSKQLFHCFGCGASGDAVAFYMKVSGLTFPEAVRELGRRVGVDVPETKGSAGDRDTQLRQRMELVNEAAREYFRDLLQEATVGQAGRTYLEQRGIEPRMIEEFHLGFAASDWERLSRALSKQGFTAAELAQAGLSVPRQATGSGTGEGHYDQFRSRVMFPISDLRRRVVGFGGRIVGPGDPKYLNSRDTPLFKKGQTLYALDLAHDAASRLDQIVVVEGYFDVIALHQAGIRNVVATLGTALTAEHVRVLRRYVNRVVLLFDPDAAGVRAALRSLDLFVDSGLAVSVMSLPEGEDPDTFVRAAGPQAFAELQQRAPSLWDFALEQSLRAADSGRLEDKVRCADAVLQLVQKIQHPIERDERIRRVADRLGISEARLKERLASLKKAGAPVSGVNRRAGAPPTKAANVEERELVHLLLQGHLNATDASRLRAEHFTVPQYRRVVEVGLRHRGMDGRILVRATLDELVGDEALAPLATELSVLERHDEDLRASVQGCFDMIERRRRESALAELVVQLKVASQAGQVEEVHKLNARVNALRLEKAGGRESVC